MLVGFRSIAKLAVSWAFASSLCGIVCCSAVCYGAPAHAIRVVIDPGHGGTDRGATSGDLSESKITLAVAEELERDLKADPTFLTVLTRVSDTYLSLEQRAHIANTEGDVFISIHVNSNADPKARGKEIYFQNQLDPDEESLFLANSENSEEQAGEKNEPRSVSLAIEDHATGNPDVRSIVEDLERNHRLRMSARLTEELHRNWGGDITHHTHSIRQAPFYVISNVSVPAALIEIGFLTNPIESKKLVDPSYQKKIAHGIYQALVKFKEVVDKSTDQHLN